MMKSLQALFAALCLCTTVAYAQVPKGSTEFGFQVGYNAATVTTGENTNSKYRSGFNIGVSADHYFSESWSLKVKALYDQKGWNRGYLQFTDGTVITDYHLDYISIPVLANWHFGRTKNWYLNFGPYAGILLNASVTAVDVDVKPMFNSADFGLDLGIGVKFPVSPKARLFIEFNGAAGISDVIKDNMGTTLRNNVSAFNVGINF